MTSRNCLTNRFTGNELGHTLDKLFSDRKAIVADYFENDPNFSAYPGEMTEGQASPILDNEHFAHFGCLYNADGPSRRNSRVAMTVAYQRAMNKVYLLPRLNGSDSIII